MIPILRFKRIRRRPEVADVVAIRARLAGVQKKRRSILAVLATVVVLGLLWVGSAWPQGGWENEGLEWVGLVCIIVAVFGRCACILYLGGHKSADLMTVGPYSVSRNPLYVFSLLAVFGIGLQTGSVVIGAVLAVAAYVVFRWLVAEEESLLRVAFGTSFERYCARVPRFWPHLSGWDSPGSVSVDLTSVWKTARDAALFFLAVPLFEAIGYAQQVGWLHAQLWVR